MTFKIKSIQKKDVNYSLEMETLFFKNVSCGLSGWVKNTNCDWYGENTDQRTNIITEKLNLNAIKYSSGLYLLSVKNKKTEQVEAIKLSITYKN